MKSRKQLVVVVCIAVAVVALGTGLSVSRYHTSQQTAAVQQPVYKPATKDELLKLVNEERAKVGVAPLTVQGELEQSAQWKADKMVATGVYSHFDPVTGKKDGLDYLNTLGANCAHVSENIEWDTNKSQYSSSASVVVRSWVDSKSHHDAMVDPKYSTTGFGISSGNIVEHFCQKP